MHPHLYDGKCALVTWPKIVLNKYPRPRIVFPFILWRLYCINFIIYISLVTIYLKNINAMIFTMHLFKISDSKIINSWLRINHVVNLDGPVFGDLQQTRGKECSKVAWFNTSKQIQTRKTQKCKVYFKERNIWLRKIIIKNNIQNSNKVYLYECVASIIQVILSTEVYLLEWWYLTWKWVISLLVKEWNK